MKLGVVILAAGASARMGRPKLLLPWKDTSVLGHLLRQWQVLGAEQITVVCSAANVAIRDELDRLALPAAHRIVNLQPERGMFSSVRCAAEWTDWHPCLTHWAVTLGDQPLVRLETLAGLLEFAGVRADQVSQPSRNGRGRHPVILPAPVFNRLKHSGAENLKQFLVTGGRPVARWEIDDPGLDLDLDEPADYQRALMLENSR
jgi:molybdenum cofactor cytidylyltransferase